MQARCLLHAAAGANPIIFQFVGSMHFAIGKPKKYIHVARLLTFTNSSQVATNSLFTFISFVD